MKDPLRVLIVEDSEDDTLLLVRKLKKGGFDPQYKRVDTQKTLMSALENQEWDLILSDYSLPHFNALSVLELLREMKLDLPCIVVSGAIGEDLAVECMRTGAHDYIMKEQLTRLIPAIERELAEARVRRERTRAKLDLEEVRAQTQAIVENAVESIITIDERGQIELFNQAAEKLFGYTREDVVGRNVSLLMPLREGGNHQGYLQDYLKGGVKKIIGAGREIFGKKKNGALFPLHISVSEITLKDRRIFTAILSDITEQKEMERALKESESKFKRLYNEAPIMYFSQDLEGNILEANQTAIEKLGYPLHQLVGKPLYELFLEKSRNRFQESCRRVVKSYFLSGEGQMGNLSGDTLDVIFTLRLEKNPLAVPHSIKTTCVDISETKRLQQQLIHADRLASIGQLAAGISHEINQPLSCISMSSEILLSQLSRETLDKNLFKSELQDILKQLDRISKIIQNIKTFSRDLPQKVIQRIQANEVVKTALSLIQRQFEKHGISIRLDLEENLPPIMGDMYRLEQVFVNLLLNSRDALEEKEKMMEPFWEKEISIATSQKKDTIEICFWDNGVGIQKSQIQKIFDPFYTTKEVGLGTGLGLSIAYGIIGEMQGQIECESKPEEWTLFKIIFPLSKELSHSY